MRKKTLVAMVAIVLGLMACGEKKAPAGPSENAPAGEQVEATSDAEALAPGDGVLEGMAKTRELSLSKWRLRATKPTSTISQESSVVSSETSNRMRTCFPIWAILRRPISRRRHTPFMSLCRAVTFRAHSPFSLM